MSKLWIKMSEGLPTFGSRVVVMNRFKEGESNQGVVKPYTHHRNTSVVLFAPDNHPRVEEPNWGYFLCPRSAGWGNDQNHNNAWMYEADYDLVHGTSEQDPTNKENDMQNLYPGALRRADGAMAAIYQQTTSAPNRDVDTIIWEGDEVYKDDERGVHEDEWRSGPEKATEHARKVLAESLKGFVAAGAKAVAKNG